MIRGNHQTRKEKGREVQVMGSPRVRLVGCGGRKFEFELWKVAVVRAQTTEGSKEKQRMVSIRVLTF